MIKAKVVPMFSSLTRLVVLLICLAAWLPADSLARGDEQPTTVTAVILRDFPPDYALENNGRTGGFAIEVLDMVAQKAGLRVKYLTKENWGEVVDALVSGQGDFCPYLAAMPQRLGALDFTSAITRVRVGLVVRESTGDINGISDLKGRRVGVIARSAAWEHLRSRSDLSLVAIEKTGEALFQLLAGQVDALAMPEPIILAMTRQAGLEDRVKIVGEPLLEFNRAMAVRKGNAELLARLDSGLRQVIDSPRFLQSYVRWYGSHPEYWTPMRMLWLISGLCVAALLAMVLWRYYSISLLNRQLLAAMDLRKEAESKAAQLAAIVASSEDSIVSMDMRGIITSWNGGAQQLFGYDAEEALGRHVSMLIPAGHPDQDMQYLGRVQAGEKLEQYETQRVSKHGDQLDLSVTLSPILDGDGRQVGVSAIARDIGKRKRAEAALKESEERHRMLFECSGDSIFIIEADGPDKGQIVAANQAAADLHGFSLPEILSMKIFELDTPGSASAAPDRIQRLMSGEKLQFEVDHNRKDGSSFPLEVTASCFQHQGRHLIIAFDRDISQRKQAEAALKDSEALFRAIFEQSYHFIGTLTTEGVVTGANRTALSFAGIEKSRVIGQYFWDTPWWSHSKEQQDKLRQAVADAAKGRYVSFETTHPDGQGNLAYIDFSIKPVTDENGKVILLVPEGRDISERKRSEAEKAKLESQLRHSQKMEAVGTLAGGIAHDFNNLLGVILGYAERAQDHNLRGKSLDHDISQIVNAASRASHLVQQILAFSRRVQANMRPTDLNRELEQLTEMLGRTIPKMVSIETELASGLDMINCDPNQIELVLLNLANNAVDAMPDGGKLLIRTRNIPWSPSLRRLFHEAKQGDYVLLEVTDSGQGMNEETRQHVFDPFYTTKEVGKGTGLGLAAVYGIVSDHGGFVICQSEPGKGTTMRVYLPSHHGQVVEAATRADSPERSLRGSERVLMVDDEGALRDMAAEALREVGYQVLTAGSGEEAVEIFREEGASLALVILDLGMPGMGGRKCLKEILTINPKAKVLIASGYAVDEIKDESLSEGAVGFLAKPFRITDLLATVRSALEAPTS